MAITLEAINLGVDADEDEEESQGSSPQPPVAAPTEAAAGFVIRTPFGSFVSLALVFFLLGRHNSQETQCALAHTQTVGSRIGRGAFAQVYKALWNETGFYVAVKCFDTSQMTKETVDSVLVRFFQTTLLF